MNNSDRGNDPRFLNGFNGIHLHCYSCDCKPENYVSLRQMFAQKNIVLIQSTMKKVHKNLANFDGYLLINQVTDWALKTKRNTKWIKHSKFIHPPYVAHFLFINCLIHSSFFIYLSFENRHRNVRSIYIPFSSLMRNVSFMTSYHSFCHIWFTLHIMHHTYLTGTINICTHEPAFFNEWMNLINDKHEIK